MVKPSGKVLVADAVISLPEGSTPPVTQQQFILNTSGNDWYDITL